MSRLTGSGLGNRDEVHKTIALGAFPLVHAAPESGPDGLPSGSALRDDLPEFHRRNHAPQSVRRDGDAGAAFAGMTLKVAAIWSSQPRGCVVGCSKINGAISYRRPFALTT